MIKKLEVALAMVLIFEFSASAFETRDLKSPEALQKTKDYWGAVAAIRNEGPELVDRWHVVGVNDPRAKKIAKAAAVKNSDGDILYMSKRNGNEIVMTFVSSVDILFFPPFSVYVDKNRLFDARDKDMIPLMAGRPLQNSGFSLYLNKDYENPGKNKDLQAFVRGNQAVFEFFTVENEIGQAAFSLKGSKMAIMELLMSE